MNLLTLMILLAGTGAKQAESDYFSFGAWQYYSFCPSLKATIKNEDCTVRLLFPLPHTDSAQKLIGKYQSSFKTNLFSDADRLNTVMVAVLEMSPGQTVTYNYNVKVALRSQTITFPPDEPPPMIRGRAAQRKQPRRFVEKTISTGLGNASIQRWAEELVADEEHPWLQARLLAAAVVDHLDYKRRNRLKGAAQTHADREGECCDYVALFVALCRSVGIPARAVAGFQFSSKGWDHHVWAEFHVLPVGWVPLDLTHAESVGVDAALGRRGAHLLAVSRDFDWRLSREKSPRPDWRDFVQADLLQEYLYVSSNGERPKTQWSLSGELLPPPTDATDDSGKRSSSRESRRRKDNP